MEVSFAGLTSAGLSQAQAEIERQNALEAAMRGRLDRAALSGNQKELYDASVEFESYFLNMLFKEMRKTTGAENSFMPKSQTEKLFTEMMDESVAGKLAEAGGIGLAAFIYRQLERGTAGISPDEFDDIAKEEAV